MTPYSMAVTTSLKACMDKLVARLAHDYPEYAFVPANTFYWSPRTKEIFYKREGGGASLLHELGHALLSHQSFGTDVDLLRKEIAAWEYARKLAPTYGITIADDEIERCLDDYRDWLYRRSACPTCGAHGVQASEKAYNCPNCQQTWNVSRSIIRRPYRRSKGALNAK